MGRTGIKDEFSKLTVSRQRKKQLRYIRDGKCSACGADRKNYATLCDECAVKRRIHQRNLRESKPWQSGKAGRIPKVA